MRHCQGSTPLRANRRLSSCRNTANEKPLCPCRPNAPTRSTRSLRTTGIPSRQIEPYQESKMSQALEGIRIIDMTHNQAGPACAQILAFLGADVIKLEEPRGGDVARRNMRDRQDSDSLFFLLFNANKRSLTLNLKTGRGKELFREL